MADNEILYNFEIDENTVGSSHNSDGVLISQRTYTVSIIDNTFHAICDIPCYPTGLFLHLDITGDGRYTDYKDLFNITIIEASEDFKIEYYPFSGILKVFGGMTKTGELRQEIDIIDALNLHIKYVWGSSVPKTYCANGETIFGYHDFKGKKIDDYDLKEKGYIGEFKEYKGTYKQGNTSVVFAANKASSSVELSLDPWPTSFDDDNFLIFIDFGSSSNITFKEYAPQQETQTIELKFKQLFILSQEISYSFSYTIAYDGISELKNKSPIIFMDPNLWCFTPRKINNDQGDEDIVRYPMYKAADVDDKHQAIYLLNTTDLAAGTYDFLSVTGKLYTYTKDDQYYESFTYGYMSNAPQAKLYDDDGNAVTIKKGPANEGAISVLDSTDNDNVQYYNKTSPVFNASLVSRYGVKGTATKAMIKDSLFAKDQKNNTKGLMEGDVNLTAQFSGYNLKKPYTIEIQNRNFASLDQFHFMANDIIYRFPLSGNREIYSTTNTITKIVSENIASIQTANLYEYFPPFVGGCYDFLNNRALTPKIIITSEFQCNGRYSLTNTNTPLDTTSLPVPVSNITGKYQVPGQFQMTTRAYVGTDTYYPSDSYYNTGSSFIYRSSGKFGYFPALEISLNSSMLSCDIGNPFVATQNNNVFYNVKTNQSNLPSLPSLEDIEIYTNLPYYYDYKGTSHSKNYSIDQFAFVLDQKYLRDAYGGGIILIGLQHDGGDFNLNFKNNKIYGSYVSSNVPNLVEEVSEERQIDIRNNKLYYNDVALRNVTYSSSFPSDSQIQSIRPPASYDAIPYNGVPLLTGWRDQDYKTVDEYDGEKLFFMRAKGTDGSGDSYGIDLYFQICQNNHSPSRIIVCAWPELREIVHKEHTYYISYSNAAVNKKVSFETNTNIEVSSDILNIEVVSLSSNGPAIEDIVIDSSNSTYIIRGTLAFYGGGGSSGTATLKFSYDTFEDEEV